MPRHHRSVAQSLSPSQLRAAIGQRVERHPVREERLRTTAGLRSSPALALSAWRGRSGRRYVVGVTPIDRADPADLCDAVVLFVARDLDGVASILRRSRDLTVVCGEDLIERACAEGATEIHVHHLAEPSERAAILADLAAFGAERVRSASPTHHRGRGAAVDLHGSL